MNCTFSKLNILSSVLAKKKTFYQVGLKVKSVKQKKTEGTNYRKSQISHSRT